MSYSTDEGKKSREEKDIRGIPKQRVKVEMRFVAEKQNKKMKCLNLIDFHTTCLMNGGDGNG